MRYVFIIMIAVICVSLMLFGAESMQSAAEGFELFISSVFPALFPFFVCVSALKYANAFGAAGGRRRTVRGGGFAGTVLRIFAISCISGSPSGTLLTDAEFGGERPLLSDRKRSELCAITNLASPVFIVGTVCTKMLDQAHLAPFIAVCHYGTAFVLALIFILKNRKTTPDAPMELPPTDAPLPHRGAQVPLSSILPAAVRDAVSTILQVGGTLIFFMVVIGLLNSVGIARNLNPCVKGCMFGVLEMTNGIGIIAKAQAALRLKCTLICTVLSLGGICVYIQANGAAHVHPAEYFKVKLIHALLSGSLCYAVYPLFTDRLAPVISIIGDSLAVRRAVTMGEVALCGALASTISALLAVFAARRTRA